MSQEEDNVDVIEKVSGVETADESVDLEPITIGEITEVTGGGNGPTETDFPVVWGTVWP